MDQMKLLLARLVVRGYVIREESYVPIEYTLVPGTGERIQSCGGYYGLSHGEAVVRAAQELGFGERDAIELGVPARLMLTWPNEALEWAKEMTTAYGDKSQPDVAAQEAKQVSEAITEANELFPAQ